MHVWHTGTKNNRTAAVSENQKPVTYTLRRDDKKAWQAANEHLFGTL